MPHTCGTKGFWYQTIRKAENKTKMYTSSIAVIVLLGSVFGYGNAQSKIACTVPESTLGVYNKAHPDNCQQFYLCANEIGYLTSCVDGLFFDVTLRTCVWPDQAKCQSAPCVPQSPPKNYAAKCCRQYTRCEDGVISIRFCENGMLFDKTTGECSNTTTCDYEDQSCNPVFFDPSVPKKCTNKPVAGNTCVYDAYDNEDNFVATMLCGMGTAFNANTCDCDIHEPNCPPKPLNSGDSLDVFNNKQIDDQCRPTFLLSYSTEEASPVSLTMKTPDGEPKHNDYYITATGYTPNKHEAIMKGDKTELYIYHFAKNMLKGPFGVTAAFRAEDMKDGDSFNLLTNGNVDCEGTLTVKATYDARDNVWLIEVKAVGEDKDGNRTTADFGSAFPIRNADDFITVSVLFDNVNIKGFAWYGSDRNSAISLGSQRLGESMKIPDTNCGIQLAGGLQGRLGDVVFHEACGKIEGLLPN